MMKNLILTLSALLVIGGAQAADYCWQIGEDNRWVKPTEGLCPDGYVLYSGEVCRDEFGNTDMVWDDTLAPPGPRCKNAAEELEEAKVEKLAELQDWKTVRAATAYSADEDALLLSAFATSDGCIDLVNLITDLTQTSRNMDNTQGANNVTNQIRKDSMDAVNGRTGMIYQLKEVYQNAKNEIAALNDVDAVIAYTINNATMAALHEQEQPYQMGSPNRTVASDCKVEIGGVDGEECFQTDNGRYFVCSEATCDGAGWTRNLVLLGERLGKYAPDGSGSKNAKKRKKAR
jgi:hypothetical protein